MDEQPDRRRIKQVIVVNEALGLPPGKLAAQVAHAAVAALVQAEGSLQRAWFEAGMPKIVLRAASAEALLRLAAQAAEAKIAAAVIRDAGRTVVEAGTVTCLGLGPDEAERMDRLTGELRLLP